MRNAIDWKHLLLSFDGRTNRAKYWLVFVASFVIMAVAVSLVFLPLFGMIAWAIIAVIWLALVYVWVAVGVKRLHDREKSGWWLLLFYLVPSALQAFTTAGELGTWHILNLIGIVISLWALVELGILRGTDGPNAYGPDPLKGSA